jgi:hypothetical protein
LHIPGLIDLIRSFPPDNEEKQNQLNAFFGTNPPPKVAGEVPPVVDAIKQQNSSISKFGILGVRPRFLGSTRYLATDTNYTDVLGRQSRRIG